MTTRDDSHCTMVLISWFL